MKSNDMSTDLRWKKINNVTVICRESECYNISLEVNQYPAMSFSFMNQDKIQCSVIYSCSVTRLMLWFWCCLENIFFNVNFFIVNKLICVGIALWFSNAIFFHMKEVFLDFLLPLTYILLLRCWWIVVFLSFCLFVFLSFCLFVFLSFCLFVFLSSCLVVLLSIIWFLLLCYLFVAVLFFPYCVLFLWYCCVADELFCCSLVALFPIVQLLLLFYFCIAVLFSKGLSRNLEIGVVKLYNNEYLYFIEIGAKLHNVQLRIGAWLGTNIIMCDIVVSAPNSGPEHTDCP